MKKLVLIGGGHAHAEVLRRYALAPAVNAAVTLVSPHRLTAYSGMLPGLIAGHYSHAQCHLDLAPLADRARIDFVIEHAVAIDPVRRVVTSESGRSFDYDFASVDIGSTPVVPDVPGLREFALLAKPVEILLAGFERIVELAREGGLDKLTVVGGGAGGVELLLAMRRRLESELPRERFEACGFSIVTDAARLLASHPEALSVAIERLFAARGISILRGAAVVAIERDAVRLANGAVLKSDVTIWAAGAQPARWLAASGLPTDARGFLAIDERLRSTGDKRIFAAGDCATSATHPRPKSGVEAVRQGPVLFANLQLALAGEVPQPWVPPEEALALISLGGREAFAVRGARVQTWPRWLIWRWKDAIDRRWMRRYRLKR